MISSLSAALLTIVRLPYGNYLCKSFRIYLFVYCLLEITFHILTFRKPLFNNLSAFTLRELPTHISLPDLLVCTLPSGNYTSYIDHQETTLQYSFFSVGRLHCGKRPKYLFYCFNMEKLPWRISLLPWLWCKSQLLVAIDKGYSLVSILAYHNELFVPFH